jgi:hypothetical protein
MKKMLTLVLCLMATLTLNAQTPQLEVKSTSWGYDYRVDGASVGIQSFRSQMGNNPEALKMFNSGQTMATTGTVIACAGGFALGYDLGGRLAGGKGNNGMLIGGGAVSVLGVVLALSGESKMKKATELYSNDERTWNIELEPQGSGVVLSLHF